MLIRLSVFAIWVWVGATVMSWGLRLLVAPASLPAQAAIASDASAARSDLRRLLGEPAPASSVAAAPAPELASRFRLIGVMAPRPPAASAQGAVIVQGGWALISVDGRPSRPFRVGARVSQELVLKSVGAGTATLAPYRAAGQADGEVSDGGAVVVLNMPALPSAAGVDDSDRNATGNAAGFGPLSPVPPAPEPGQAPADAPEVPPSGDVPAELPAGRPTS